MNIYPIENEQLISKLISDPDNQNLLFDQMPGTFDEKIAWIAKHYKNLEAEYDAVKNVMLEMNNRCSSILGDIEDCENFIKSKILGTGLIDPIKTKDFVIKVQFNRASVNITNPALIPDVYKVTKEVISFDKNQLYKDISDGFAIDGAELEHKTKLVIK